MDKTVTSSTKQSRRQRRFALVVTIVLAAAILIGGTYAWQSVNAAANVGAKGLSGAAGGRLHDDYEFVGDDYGISSWTAYKTANKDIYVENYESAADGRDIFVRLKLYEYMEIGKGAGEEPLQADGLTPNQAYTDRDAKPLAENADRDDVTTWTPRLPGEDETAGSFSSKWDWKFGGSKSYMPTFNRDNHSEETDIKGDARDMSPVGTNEKPNATKSGQPYAYAKEAGLSDFFVNTAAYEAPEKYWDNSLNGGAGGHAMKDTNAAHTAKLTETAIVMTMDEWKAAGSTPGDFWVLDADGWCYWANPLAPETATGLLLDSITLYSEPEEEWYYGIYVKSEMATAGDWTADAAGQGFYANESEKPSADAEVLLSIVTGSSPKVTGLSIDREKAALGIGETLTLTAFAETESTNDPSWKEVSWTIAPDAGSRFANGAFTPSASDAGKWFTITAVSAKDSAFSAECKVYVPEAGYSAITGLDGNFYVYPTAADDNTYKKVNADGTLEAPVCPVQAGKPGEATDRAVTVIGGQNYIAHKTLSCYYAAGDDGKLGTADDALVYDNGSSIQNAVEGSDGELYADNGDNTYQKINADGALETSIVCPVTEEQPGAASDRAVTIIGGQKTLPYGDGIHYYAAGSDGKLGVSPDTLMYDDDGTLKPSAATATLTVTPAANKVLQGYTLGFTAAAMHDGKSVVNGVTWSITSTHNAGTTISGSGANATLTVAAAETATKLTIRASYSGLGATTKDTIVTVNVIPPIGTATFTDSTGVVWRILKDNRPKAGTPTSFVTENGRAETSTGSGTVLLVTEHVYGTGGLNSWYSGYQYNGAVSDVPWVQYDKASIKSDFDRWYSTNVSAPLKAEACIPNLKYESDTARDLLWSDDYNLDSAISKAGSKAGATKSGVVFPLSISEVNRYIGNTDALRAATDVQGTAQKWWLRSTGRISATYGSCVTTSGIVNNERVSLNYYALRPAMWVYTTP